MPLNLRQPNKATKVDQEFEGTISVNPVMLGNKTDYPSINSAIMRRNRLRKADADMMDLMGEQTFTPETPCNIAEQQQILTQTPNRDDIFQTAGPSGQQQAISRRLILPDDEWRLSGEFETPNSNRLQYTGSPLHDSLTNELNNMFGPEFDPLQVQSEDSDSSSASDE